MDLDALLGEISDDAPSGVDLEYDSEFEALSLAATVKEAQQIGDEVLEAKPPDYEDVRDKALSLLARSHDLRVAMHLATAELETSGFSGFADVLGYMRRCLDERWETCHPTLDEDDDNDPTMRVNVLRGLMAPDGILRTVQRAPLTDSRGFGRFSKRDIDIATGARAVPPDMETAPDMAAISAAFQDTDDEKLAALNEAIGRAREEIEGIAAVFTDRIPTSGPDLQPIKSLLSEVQNVFAKYTGGSIVEDAGADETEQTSSASGGGNGAARGSFSGGISSADDVVRALEEILAYYARSEPSSPLPILLDRAKRLVRADFVTIMQDIAPEGMANVRVVGGLPEEESEY